MNDVMMNMLERRSIREYEETRVSKEDMAEVLNAGAWAPSAMNRQGWKLTGVIDPEKVRKLAAAVKKALGLSESEAYSFYDAPGFIIASSAKGYANAAPDCACAMENMMLAARSIGLGTVWINQLKDTCNDAGVRALLTSFGVPEDHDVYSSCAIGRARREAKAPDRVPNATAIVE